MPRKKIQIQFHEVINQFENQVNLLESTLEYPDLPPTTLEVGKILLQDARRFQELHLPRINQNRLEEMVRPLLHPVDFSLWVLYQMHSYTEEIFHYIKTVEVVPL